MRFICKFANSRILEEEKQIRSGIDGKDNGFRFPEIQKYCVILGHSNNVWFVSQIAFFYYTLSWHVHMIILKTVILTEEYQRHPILCPSK